MRWSDPRAVGHTRAPTLRYGAEHMDGPRVERIAREIIAAYGFPCELLDIHERPGSWLITVRHQNRRIIDFEVPSSTPATLRAAIVARLEMDC